jgi:hypothetical protein
MKARGLVPIIFILSTFTLFSQVKIKEKVEINPGRDTCALRYPWTGYDYTYIGITVESTILSNDGYFILNGGSEYPIKLKLVHDYVDPETLEPIHEESDFSQSQLFSTSVHIYEDTVGNTAFISGEDTCMCLSGIPQGFKLYAGNELYKDTNNFIITIQTVNGAYSGGVGIRILKSQLITTLEPAELSAGDTVSIFIKRKNIDGTIKEFLPEQKFEAGILEGCDYGKFIWEGLKETVHIRDTVYTNDSVYVKDSTYIKDKDSVYVKDVKQPIKFIVANTFDTTISIVKLRIGVKRKYCFDESTLLKSSGQNRQTIENNYCTLVDFEYGDYATLDETIKKNEPELEIIYPTKDSEDKWITEEPKMPEIICKARLKNNYFGGFYSLDWFFIVSWKRNHGGYTQESFVGTVQGFNHNIVEINIPWGNKIIGGDKIILQLSTVTNKGLFTKKIENPFKISGKNPSVQSVKEGLTLQLQVIVYKETDRLEGKWKHFYLSGYPVFGPPHGYGLMQLDPPDNDQQYWNWQENKEEGKRRLLDKYVMAKALYNKLRKVNHNIQYYDDTELLMQTFQLYNGGYYYNAWVPNDKKHPEKGGNWKKGNPKVWHGHDDSYAEEAWEIYSDVIDGNYPPYWN